MVRTSVPCRAQIKRRQHPERHRSQAHQKHHHHRPEDGRKNPALRIRLPGLGGQELPQPFHVDAGLAEQAHVIGTVGADDIGHRHPMGLSTGQQDRHVPGFSGLPQAGKLAGQALVSCPVAPALPVQFRNLRSLPPLQLKPALLQAKLLDAAVQVRNGAVFDLPHPLQNSGRLPHAFPERRPSGLARPGHLAVAFVHPLDKPVHVAPFAPLKGHRIGRRGLRPDLVLIHPSEIDAIDVPVAHLELDAMPHRRPALLGRYLLPVPHQSHHRLPVRQFARHQRAGPEETRGRCAPPPRPAPQSSAGKRPANRPSAR